MGKPVLVAVDSEPDILAAMERDLARRFAVDYRIVTSHNSETVLAELDADDDVAVAMAGQWLAETSGVDFLRACHQLYPAAKRLLLITYGDAAGGTAALRAMALGHSTTTSTSPGATRSSSCIRQSLSCSASEIAPRSRQAPNQQCCALSGRGGRPARMSCGTSSPATASLIASTTSPTPKGVGCCCRPGTARRPADRAAL